MSTAILDLDRTQLLEKNKAIKTDSRSLPSLATDLLESIDLSISANFLNNTLVSSTNNRNESLVKTDTVTNTDITLTSNLGSDKFESNGISTLTNSSNNSLIPGIINETNSSIDNKFETIGEEAFFGDTAETSLATRQTNSLLASQDTLIGTVPPSIRQLPRVIKFNFNVYTGTNAFGAATTTISTRIDPSEGFTAGNYFFRGQLRNVQIIRTPGGGTIYQDNVTPVPFRISEIIRPGIAFEDNTFLGDFNLIQVAGGNGTGVDATGLVPFIINPQIFEIP